MFCSSRPWRSKQAGLSLNLAAAPRSFDPRRKKKSPRDGQANFQVEGAWNLIKCRTECSRHAIPYNHRAQGALKEGVASAGWSRAASLPVWQCGTCEYCSTAVALQAASLQARRRGAGPPGLQHCGTAPPAVRANLTAPPVTQAAARRGISDTIAESGGECSARTGSCSGALAVATASGNRLSDTTHQHHHIPPNLIFVIRPSAQRYWRCPTDANARACNCCAAP